MTETMKGINKDRLRYEAAKDIYEQACGKPTQKIEVEIEGELGITPLLKAQVWQYIVAMRKQEQLPGVVVEEIEAQDVVEDE